MKTFKDFLSLTLAIEVLVVGLCLIIFGLLYIGGLWLPSYWVVLPQMVLLVLLIELIYIFMDWIW